MNVTLRGAAGRRLAELAASLHLRPATLASTVLTNSMEHDDPESQRVTDLLNRIPGAWDRIARSGEQARLGKTIALDDLGTSRGQSRGHRSRPR